MSAKYTDVKSVLNKYGYQFAHELCGLCHAGCDKIVTLPPRYRKVDIPQDDEEEAEHVTPPTTTYEQLQKLYNQPAFAEQDLCVVCKERPREAGNPFRRGTKAVAGTKRWNTDSIRQVEAAADKFAVSDAEAALSMAGAAVGYCAIGYSKNASGL